MNANTRIAWRTVWLNRGAGDALIAPAPERSVIRLVIGWLVLGAALDVATTSVWKFAVLVIALGFGRLWLRRGQMEEARATGIAAPDNQLWTIALVVVIVVGFDRYHGAHPALLVAAITSLQLVAENVYQRRSVR